MCHVNDIKGKTLECMLYTNAGLFDQTQLQLLWDEFNHAAFNVQRNQV